VQFDVVARGMGVDVQYYWQDDLTLQLSSPVDLIFIDTYHIYGQLKRELQKFSPWARKFLVLHDTTVDAEVGELVRLGHDKEKALEGRDGWVEEDVVNGLWRAVEEFLGSSGDEWELQHRYTNNNGLTVLRRKVPLHDDGNYEVIKSSKEENSRLEWRGLL
jgi:cephalosporin hydroxylase